MARLKGSVDEQGAGVNGTGRNGVSKDSDLGALVPVGLRLLLEKVAAILWTTDRDLRVTASLGSGLLSLGMRPGQSAGLTLYEYLGHRDDSMPPIAAHLAALRGESRDFDYEWNDRLVTARTEPLRAEGGPVIGVVGVAVDVTDLRALERDGKLRERELREARKHEQAARLSKVRLSEMADVLTALLGVSERLQTLGGPSDPRASDLEQLVRVASRGAELVRGLREGAPGETTEREPKTPVELDGAETILLVDDEPQVRGFVRRALEEHGYRILEAGVVDEALALGASYPGQIHLLLTDVVLPGMSGPQLAARLAPLRPEMRILYMTGYADDAIVHRGVLSAGQSLLVKPFTSLGLAHEVKKALRV
jgi:CheY-like chemotaxis protein